MGEIKKTYDLAFKKKAVDLYLKEEMGYKSVAKELDIDLMSQLCAVGYSFRTAEEVKINENVRLLRRALRNSIKKSH